MFSGYCPLSYFMPNGFVYGIWTVETRFRRRSASRSTPITSAARSISRSIAKVTSGRPEERYAWVGVVWVNTARARTRASGIA